ncbi:DUF2384 domain-containing protein [Rhodoblastus acidophilus]|uniref:DUF2384 domain-containing protein n=1 Tax=Candidatus Rhodoblastus alkanivorans TaxID=2954117 RepID=A0ABS9Z9P1_9HYPH|nr:antitoxin Xre/MbcA/ParS toxin-binding domain-containing protein [Candidatus Rhodoblastus alkanivorans]MCI4679843.1 DUF2384 domain-containing protein [Candidatus Rhodoblastus alkanivorans]MCI4684349.1 DUF2384 domain-containing protein [Candidatus Rhodoblastus alkanivorans]MDI4641670.1 DUF2384 domain-containing protein [Rhodoblastus acidophilus]
MNTIHKAAELLGLNISQAMGDQETRILEGLVRNGPEITSSTLRVTHLPPRVRLLDKIREGFPVGAVQHIVDSGRLNLSEVDQVVLPRKTLANRRKVGALTADQSDRLLRVARVIAAAEEVFGNAEKAHVWLRRPTTALDGEPPLDLLDTEEGAREVETLLTRIAHGIAA